jgi:lysozyme family protein
LQDALEVQVDGKIGPITKKAIEDAHTNRTVRGKFLAARLRFLGRLITDDPKQAVFAAGWLNRVAEFVEGV